MNKKMNTSPEFLKKKHSVRKTDRRNSKPEVSYAEYKLGLLIHNARVNKGLTQKQLAEKCGTSRACISKIENNAKGVRISSLRKIVVNGLDGHLQLSVRI
ncbi:MAG TPA: helix-turn-helix transcriptional regulator [Ignavibacteria bacterium]|nr:helix-turn-helix transcriptional regulator [Ignavibacteria bacterium]